MKEFGQTFTLLWLSLMIVSSYRMDILEEDEAQHCNYRSHLTFKPTATCCAKKVVVPGIDIALHWPECSNNAKGNSLESVGWDIYSCILKKHFEDKEEITLQDFADLVAGNYPDDIKSSINATVKKESVAAAPFTDIPKLEKIRVTYYDIETAVCSKSKPAAFGQVDESCTVWKEENHRAGLCCNSAYPIDLKYGSIYEVPAERKETIMQNCRKKLEDHAGEDKLGMTDTILNNLLEICEMTCVMSEIPNANHLMDSVLERVQYLDFNVTTELQTNFQWFPSVLPNNVVAEAKQFVESMFSFENTTRTMTEYGFADGIETESHTFRPHHFFAFTNITNTTNTNRTDGVETFRLDFVRRKFHKKMLHVAILCSAYNEITSWIDYSIFRSCPYAEFKYPTTTKKPTTTSAE